MIIFLYGPDSYRRRKKFVAIFDQYRQKHSHLSSDQFSFDGSCEVTEEFSRLREFLSHGSLFSGVRLATIDFAWDELPETFDDVLRLYVKQDDVVLLLTCDTSQSDVPKSFSFLLRSPVVSQEFKTLRGDQLSFFIQKEAQERELSLTPAFVEFLKHVFGGDTWAITNEIEKAALFRFGTRGTSMDSQTFDSYGVPTANLFSFISLLSRRGVLSEKLGMLEDLSYLQEEPVKIFNILASRQQLPSDFLEQLADYDVMVKSGKLEYDDVLLDLVLN